MKSSSADEFVERVRKILTLPQDTISKELHKALRTLDETLSADRGTSNIDPTILDSLAFAAKTISKDESSVVEIECRLFNIDLKMTIQKGSADE